MLTLVGMLILSSFNSVQGISPFTEIGNLEEEVLAAINDVVIELMVQTERIDLLNSTQVSEQAEQDAIQTDIAILLAPVYNLHQENYTIPANTGFHNRGTSCPSGEVIISGGVELLFPAIGIQGFSISPMPATNSFNATIGSASVDIIYRISAYCLVLP